MIEFAKSPINEAALYWYKIKVDRVVDGDTFVGTINFGFNLARTGQYFRLAFVDTPERGQAGFQEATDFLRDKIEGKEVLGYSHKDDTGRWKRIVVDCIYEDENINRALLDGGYAVISKYA